MTHLFKVILALAAGILLYYTLHLIVALVSLVLCVLLVAVLFKAYKSYKAETGA
ncbi:hypothetical protein [Taibaiella chishuiensis]|uniref:Uncharacterized protein n=1 Tax=Taibaiella chishuiensis TaxID=1434707 RepID=A0A2P8DAS6_9BACT|nr:hypothetical protein [Taibaiella chishuiensis]PSK94324.1 hypothetical protein B0I18_101479 [Taibaiella chishuiensis]